MSRILIIAGQVAGVAAALFLSVFALDAAAPDASLWQNLIGLAIHMLPSAVLIAFVLVSWRWPVVGGVLLLIVALAPFVLLSNALWVNALLAVLPALAGLLLVIGGLMARQG